MPFARVGVIPHPNQPMQRNGNQRGGGGPPNHQKGITMEDLKRQTAMRLAQEQTNHGHLPPPDESLNYPLRNRPPPTVQQRMLPVRYPPAETRRDHHHYTAVDVPQGGQSLQHPYYRQQHNYRNSTYENYPNQQLQRGQYSDRGPEHVYSHRGQRMNYDHQHNFRQTVQSQSGINSSDHKLPHGLTVQELKEMTKARLQAEAAARHEIASSQENSPHRRLSPIDFDAPEVRERSMSRDSASLGSESVFSSGIGSGVLSQPDSDFASIPFNRSLSYTTGQSKAVEAKIVDGRSITASPSSSGSLLFAAAVGPGNRRRAATLSPKAGSILEDFPQVDANLAMPNFSSSARTPLHSRSNQIHGSSSVQRSDNSFFSQTSSLFGFDGVSNRARAESATSLPPISHTAEEFALDNVHKQLPVPPGFSSTNGMDSVGSLVSYRHGYNQAEIEDTLADDLGSVLNLSVGEPRPDRARLNTYPQSSTLHAPDYISEEFFNKDGDAELRL